MTRYITWACKRCSLVVPSSSSAKNRFDTFCPRCNQRNTIYWGRGQKTIFDGRGAPRKVRFRSWPSIQKARREALLANWKIAELKHSMSLWRDKVPETKFRKASELDSQPVRNLKLRKARERRDP